jgi:hypothetical protein
MATEDANPKDSPVMPCDSVWKCNYDYFSNSVYNQSASKVKLLFIKYIYIFKLFSYINVKNYYFNIFKNRKHNTKSTTTLQTRAAVALFMQPPPPPHRHRN